MSRYNKLTNHFLPFLFLIFVFLLSNVCASQTFEEVKYDHYKSRSSNFQKFQYILSDDTLSYDFFASRRGRYHDSFRRLEGDSLQYFSIAYQLNNVKFSFRSEKGESSDKTSQNLNGSRHDRTQQSILFFPMPFFTIHSYFAMIRENFYNYSQMDSIYQKNDGYEDGYRVQLNYDVWDHVILDSEYALNFRRLKITDSDSSRFHVNISYDRKKPQTTRFNLSFTEKSESEQRQRDEGLATKNIDTWDFQGSVETFPIKNLTFKFVSKFYQRKVLYDSDDSQLIQSRNNQNHKGKSLQIDLQYRLFKRKLSIKSIVYWKEERTNYQKYVDNHTGEERKLKMDIDYKFIRNGELSLSRQLDLIQYKYFDWRNVYDRDQFYDNIDVNLKYKYKKRGDFSIRFSTKESQLIYIESEKSASNKKTNTYSLESQIRLKFWNQIQYIQKNRFNADYTVYDFNDNANMLYRRFVFSNQLTYFDFNTVLKDTVFSGTVGHTMKTKDQGGYEYNSEEKEWLYSKNSEESIQMFTLTLHQNINDVLHIRPFYSVEFIQQRRVYPPNNSSFSRQRYRTTLDGKYQNFIFAGDISRVCQKQEEDYWEIDGRIIKEF